MLEFAAKPRYEARQRGLMLQPAVLGLRITRGHRDLVHPPTHSRWIVSSPDVRFA
jgi:hypothetical protein